MARERKNWPDDGSHSAEPGFPVPEGIKGWCFRCQAYCGGEDPGVKCNCCRGNPPPEREAATGADVIERQQQDPDLRDDSGSRP
jgi:hypothetical protein